MQLRVVPGGRAQRQQEAEAAANEPNSDRALLARVVKHDHAAHRSLFDRYYRRVFSFVQRRVRDEGLAEEVTADVFFEVWRNAASYRGESPVSTWIFGIANLKALSARRFYAQPRRASVRVTPDEVLSRVADPGDAGAAIDARDELTRVLGAIEKLPEGQREVLRLAFLEGRSYPEIAEELQISEANVKTRVNRARTRLRSLSRYLPQSQR